MPEKRTGTYFIDGIVEGPIPGIPGVAGKLEEWVRFAASAHLRFSLETDGGSFSLLAENTPSNSVEIGAGPEEHVSRMLEQLLKAFPPGDRQKLFSTLRSVEYGDGKETQAVYTIGKGGTVEVRSRTIGTKTIPRTETRTAWQKVRAGIIGGAAAVFIVGIAVFLFRDRLAGMFRDMLPIDPGSVAFDAAPYKEFFTVKAKGLGPGGKYMVLDLTRAEKFPADDASLQRLYDEVRQGALEHRLAVEALGRGCVRCEYFDGRDEFIGAAELRVAGLRSKKTVEVSIPMPPRARPSRIRLLY